MKLKHGSKTRFEKKKDFPKLKMVPMGLLKGKILKRDGQ